MAKRRAVTTKKQSKSQGCLIVVVGIFGLLLLISQGFNSPNRRTATLTQNAGVMTVTAGNRQAATLNSRIGITSTPRPTARAAALATNQSIETDESVQATQTAEEAIREGQSLGATATSQAMATRAVLMTRGAATAAPATQQTQSSNDVMATYAARPTVEAPTDAPEMTTYYAAGSGNINARASASTSAAVVTTFARGDTVQVIDQVQGDAVNGNRTWFRIDVDGRNAYVHSSLLSQTRPSAQAQQVQQQAAPAATAVPQQPAQQQVQPPAVPQQQVPPTAPPAQPTAIPQQSSGGSGGSSGARPGNCSTAVAMGLSAEQAAQWPHLDRDGDHVACYGD